MLGRNNFKKHEKKKKRKFQRNIHGGETQNKKGGHAKEGRVLLKEKERGREEKKARKGKKKG